MASIARVTVTLPEELLKSIDRLEVNRSKFIAEAVRREVERRRREQLRISLENPHPDSLALADEGYEEWFQSLPEEDAESLVDMSAGTPVRWVPGEGWVEEHG